MRHFIKLASFILCLASAVAQPMPGAVMLASMRKAAGGNTDIPSTISGLTVRLKASDNAIGTLATWTDEISSRLYTNSSASTQPTNSASGVWFLSGHYLKQDESSVAGYNFDGTKAVFVVYSAISPANYGSIIGAAGAENLMGYSTGPNEFGLNGSGTLKWVNSYPVSGVVYDVINAGGSSGNPQCYSNGVATLTFSTAGSAFTFDFLGVNQASHVDGFQGYLKELCIWDKGATTLTSVQVSNLHYYATNTYGYSP